jgi:hypothetical protein
MKLTILLMFACASVYGADTLTNTADDLSTNVVNVSGKDGHPDTRIETVYRGKTKVVMIMSHRNAKGATAVTRSYLVGGRMVMAEIDEDGDGRFESVTVWNPSTEDFEMFTREADGSLKPVSTAVLQATKKQKAAADESLRRLLEQTGGTR